MLIKKILSTKSKPEILSEISHCHILASRALNMSGYFDQAVHLIESRCVVKLQAIIWNLSDIQIKFQRFDNDICNLSAMLYQSMC